MSNDTSGAVASNAELDLMAQLKSLQVLLGTDSPEVRGWSPAVRQSAEATVNTAIRLLKEKDQAATALLRWEAYRKEIEEAELQIGKVAGDFIDLKAWEDAGRCALRAEGMRWVRGRMPNPV